jgi:RNA polymerase sigma-70 factor (ECF subfamily)
MEEPASSGKREVGRAGSASSLRPHALAPSRLPADGQAPRLADLIGQCALGSQAAFAELYRATAPKLFGVAVRILRREDWAEDVLQECYVSVWTHAADYALAKSAPLTWMAAIVRNRCLDWLRRPRPESGGEEYDIVAESWAANAPGPMEQLLAAADAGALARCLARLESRQRQSIALAFFHGLSHSELAAHMREPLGTVKTWVRRGLERLRACLNEGTA